MNKIESILKKIYKIEALVTEVKNDLSAIKDNNISKKKSQKNQITPSDSELQNEYGELYMKFIDSDPSVVKEFVISKTKDYLKSFCKANNIPINIRKASKERIAEEIINWFNQKKVISQKAK